ncbi:hypothetical protein THRCLA_02347 [Thraustotheca clavata]|uniref:Uncharacterized protein n=1 Tax=Thraustotheca clavata TaxID=74557 RepID=A0A1W0A5N6_9STRA|nr:hypothetical protein THRCLA_02347 [Thraustotheca clavata]
MVKRKHSLGNFYCPEPLRRPNDELVLDPDCPQQTFTEWLNDPNRNPVTSRRKTIYVVPPPILASNATAFVKTVYNARATQKSSSTNHPSSEDVAEFIKAFYTGFIVKVLSAPEMTVWDSSKKYVGLIPVPGKSTSSLRVRIRAARDKMFAYQLNLDDLLDGLIEDVVTVGTYAVVWLVEHDLYEGKNDDFTCGRAYGASRVAVVSSARYHPSLDNALGLSSTDVWPLCHDKEPDNTIEAIKGAIDAYSTDGDLKDIWLGRICRTVVHELGHCFGIEHCVKFACCMQGSASLAEDLRQPPYLCPSDLEKVLYATSTTVMDHFTALANFCQVYKNVPLFASLGAWLSVVNVNPSKKIAV